MEQIKLTLWYHN